MGWLPSLRENYNTRKEKYKISIRKYDTKNVITALSSERLNSYLSLTSSNDDAVISYDIVQRLSSMFFIPLHYFEITLRNRVYEVLKEHYRWRGKKYKELGDPDTWPLWMPKDKIVKRKINEAYNYAKRNVKGRPIVIWDTLSNLSLGTWIEILNERPQQNSHYHFWIFTQNKIFPNAHNQTRKTILHELIEIKNIRNRLFHYEPIWHKTSTINHKVIMSEIHKKYQQITNAIYWLSEDVYNFINEHNQTNHVSRQVNLFSNELFKLSIQGDKK